MKCQMNRVTAVLATLLLGGCTSAAHPRPVETNASESSLCEISENFQGYTGMDVQMKARYVSDGRHEEVLEDRTCSQGRRIIDIGRRGDSHSVEKFYAARKRLCDERGASYLCNTSAEIEVSGTIRVMSGELVIDLKDVKNFLFLDSD